MFILQKHTSTPSPSLKNPETTIMQIFKCVTTGHKMSHHYITEVHSRSPCLNKLLSQNPAHTCMS